MKAIYILCLLLLPITVFSQTLKLEISNPQPRLGENFTLSINIDTLSTDLFSVLSGKFNTSPYKNNCSEGTTAGISMEATKIGKKDIAPLSFSFNNKKFITEGISFEVVDSLPPVNKGIWVRKVPINDTSVYLIIEQRIPALTYVTRSANSINMETKTNDDDKAMELQYLNVKNLSFKGGHSEPGSTIDPKTGDRIEFNSNFSLYLVNTSDIKNPVILTKENFNDIPDYYKFQDIVFN